MAATEKTTLNMQFDSAVSTRTVSVDAPLTTLDGEGVSNVMNEIIGLSTVCDSKGNLVEIASGATLRTTTVQQLFPTEQTEPAEPTP